MNKHWRPQRIIYTPCLLSEPTVQWLYTLATCIVSFSVHYKSNWSQWLCLSPFLGMWADFRMCYFCFYTFNSIIFQIWMANESQQSFYTAIGCVVKVHKPWIKTDNIKSAFLRESLRKDTHSTQVCALNNSVLSDNLAD